MPRLQGAIFVGPYPGSRTHSHREWELGIYTAGSGTAVIGQQRFALSAGSEVCYPPDIPHSDHGDATLSGYFFGCDRLPLLERLPPMVVDPDHGSGARLAALVHDQWSRGAAGQAVAQSLFDALLALLRRHHGLSRSGHPLVERLASLLREGVGDPSFSIAAALASLPMSQDHLRRRFTREIGMTPIRYLTQARIARARELLRMGRSVKQASREAGFDDPFYFSRAFRAATGEPPSRLRS